MYRYKNEICYQKNDKRINIVLWLEKLILPDLSGNITVQIWFDIQMDRNISVISSRNTFKFMFNDLHRTIKKAKVATVPIASVYPFWNRFSSLDQPEHHSECFRKCWHSDSIRSWSALSKKYAVVQKRQDT